MASNPLADDATLEVAVGIDITTLVLSQDEGLLLGRIMGRRANVHEVVVLSGMQPERAKATIAQLVIKGALTVIDFGTEPAASERPDAESVRAADSYEDMEFSATALAEETDLTLEQKKRILFLEAQLSSSNHYALLKVKRTAKSEEIKKAFYKASKEFHPDTYFRKELGSYKRRIDAVFRGMKVAYDILTHQDKRAEYDATLPADFSTQEQAEFRRIAEEHRQKRRDQDRDLRMKERMRERRLKRNPMLGRVMKAHKFIKAAQTSRDNGQPSDAARHAKMALQYAPHDAEVVALARRIIKVANEQRAKVLVLGASELMEGRDREAMCATAEEMATLSPNDPQVLVTAARLLLEGGRPHRGLKYAQSASEANKDMQEVWEVLFLLASETNSWATAHRAAEQLLSIEPKNSQFKEWMKLAKRRR